MLRTLQLLIATAIAGGSSALPRGVADVEEDMHALRRHLERSNAHARRARQELSAHERCVWNHEECNAATRSVDETLDLERFEDDILERLFRSMEKDGVLDREPTLRLEDFLDAEALSKLDAHDLEEWGRLKNAISGGAKFLAKAASSVTNTVVNTIAEQKDKVMAVVNDAKAYLKDKLLNILTFGIPAIKNFITCLGDEHSVEEETDTDTSDAEKAEAAKAADEPAKEEDEQGGGRDEDDDDDDDVPQKFDRAKTEKQLNRLGKESIKTTCMKLELPAGSCDGKKAEIIANILKAMEDDHNAGKPQDLERRFGGLFKKIVKTLQEGGGFTTIAGKAINALVTPVISKLINLELPDMEEQALHNDKDLERFEHVVLERQHEVQDEISQDLDRFDHVAEAMLQLVRTDGNALQGMNASALGPASLQPSLLELEQGPSQPQRPLPHRAVVAEALRQLHALIDEEMDQTVFMNELEEEEGGQELERRADGEEELEREAEAEAIVGKATGFMDKAVQKSKKPFMKCVMLHIVSPIVAYIKPILVKMAKLVMEKVRMMWDALNIQDKLMQLLNLGKGWAAHVKEYAKYADQQVAIHAAKLCQDSTTMWVEDMSNKACAAAEKVDQAGQMVELGVSVVQDTLQNKWLPQVTAKLQAILKKLLEPLKEAASTGVDMLGGLCGLVPAVGGALCVPVISSVRSSVFGAINNLGKKSLVLFNTGVDKMFTWGETFLKQAVSFIVNKALALKSAAEDAIESGKEMAKAKLEQVGDKAKAALDQAEKAVIDKTNKVAAIAGDASQTVADGSAAVDTVSGVPQDKKDQVSQVSSQVSAQLDSVGSMATAVSGKIEEDGLIGFIKERAAKLLEDFFPSIKEAVKLCSATIADMKAMLKPMAACLHGAVASATAQVEAVKKEVEAAELVVAKANKDDAAPEEKEAAQAQLTAAQVHQAKVTESAAEVENAKKEAENLVDSAPSSFERAPKRRQLRHRKYVAGLPGHVSAAASRERASFILPSW